jgi:hypothetical protein
MGVDSATSSPPKIPPSNAGGAGDTDAVKSTGSEGKKTDAGGGGEKKEKTSWVATGQARGRPDPEEASAAALAAAEQAAAARAPSNFAPIPATTSVSGPPAVGASTSVSGPSGVGAATSTQPAMTTYPGGIDRRWAYSQLSPEIVRKMAWMARGEVGASAPLDAKIAITETLLNRVAVRDAVRQQKGQRYSLAEGLWSVGESSRGYYARDTYRQPPPSAAEVDAFVKNVLTPVLAGSNVSDRGSGPMTGNASGSVAAHQLQRGTPGYGMRIAGGQTEYLFNEEHKNLKDGTWLKRLDETAATDAAQKALEKFPGGVLPTGPNGLMTGMSETDAVQNLGNNEPGPGGGSKHGHHSYNPAPMDTPGRQQAAGKSPFEQWLAGMGLSAQQIAALMAAMNGNPAFAGMSDEEKQQYMMDHPQELEQMLQPGWQQSATGQPPGLLGGAWNMIRGLFGY